MKITKLEHSGLCFEKDGQILLCDPVEFKEQLLPFNRVAAIIITHKHDDHCQPETIAKILAANPSAQIFTTSDTTSLIGGSIAVTSGETREVGGFKIQFFGKNHASVIEGEIPCANLGFVVDDLAADPGDSFDIPPVTPKALFVPISAPWCKASDAISYITAVKPEIAIPIHDAVLSDLGKTYSNSWLKITCDSLGIKFAPLSSNNFLEV